jgi:hypothetical protein
MAHLSHRCRGAYVKKFKYEILTVGDERAVERRL